VIRKVLLPITTVIRLSRAWEHGKHLRRLICRPIINYDDAKARECLALKAFYCLCYRRCAIEHWHAIGTVCFARTRSISVICKRQAPLKSGDNFLIRWGFGRLVNITLRETFGKCMRSSRSLRFMAIAILVMQKASSANYFPTGALA
jgi:hypothetical protein